MDIHRVPVKRRLGLNHPSWTRVGFHTSIMSNVGEIQPVARISVKDRLGPLPSVDRERRSSFKRRGRSIDRNHRRGRKFAKSAQGPAETNNNPSGSPKTRIPVHERLGLLPQQQSFKKTEQFFHKRNRQQVWRHQGYHEAAAQQQSQSKEPELKQHQHQQGMQTFENVENNAPFVKQPPVQQPFPRVQQQIPRAQPFNAEQHRQTWTWVRPSANSSEMDIDENMEKSS